MGKIVALLDSFWGTPEQAGRRAPRFFRINRNNHSGRNLYRLVGLHSLIVTDVCKEVQCSANHHGSPDLEWTRENLIYLKNTGRMDLLLVCGKVARSTFEAIASLPSGATDGLAFIPNSGVPLICWYGIDHPAARRWSIEKLEQSKTHIERLIKCLD